MRAADVLELGLGLAREEFRYADCAGAWGTHVADGSFLVDLCLEILENALVNHFVVREWMLMWGDES